MGLSIDCLQPNFFSKDNQKTLISPSENQDENNNNSIKPKTEERINNLKHSRNKNNILSYLNTCINNMNNICKNAEVNIGHNSKEKNLSNLKDLQVEKTYRINFISIDKNTMENNSHQSNNENQNNPLEFYKIETNREQNQEEEMPYKNNYNKNDINNNDIYNYPNYNINQDFNEANNIDNNSKNNNSLHQNIQLDNNNKNENIDEIKNNDSLLKESNVFPNENNNKTDEDNNNNLNHNNNIISIENENQDKDNKNIDKNINIFKAGFQPNKFDNNNEFQNNNNQNQKMTEDKKNEIDTIELNNIIENKVEIDKNNGGIVNLKNNPNKNINLLNNQKEEEIGTIREENDINKNDENITLSKEFPKTFKEEIEQNQRDFDINKEIQFQPKKTYINHKANDKLFNFAKEFTNRDKFILNKKDPKMNDLNGFTKEIVEDNKYKHDDKDIENFIENKVKEKKIEDINNLDKKNEGELLDIIKNTLNNINKLSEKGQVVGAYFETMNNAIDYKNLENEEKNMREAYNRRNKIKTNLIGLRGKKINDD